MTSSSSSRRRWLALAAALLAAAVLLLAATGGPNPEQLQFFGRWRLLHVLPALGLGWLALMAVCRAISRAALIRGIALAFLGGVTWLLLELAGLVGLVHYPQLLGGEVHQMGTRPEPHVDVRGETWPDLMRLASTRPDPIPFHFRTDRHGFRNAEDLAEADLYLLGDSVLVAGLLDIEDTVTRQLARRLDRSTLSIALIAISPQRERDLLIESSLPLQGRAVLHFLFEGNDAVDSRHYREHSDVPVEGSPLENSLFKQLTVLLQRKTDPNAIQKVGELPKCKVRGREAAFAYAENAYEGLEGELPEIAVALAETRRHVEAKGGRYALVYVPMKLRVLGPQCSWPEGSRYAGRPLPDPPMRAWLTSWAKQQGIPLLDLSQALIDAAEAEDLPWFLLDTHPNARGHEVMADALAGWPVLIELTRRP